MKIGKRYWWYINNYKNKIKSGLFTGIFEKDLMERDPLK